MGGGKIEEDIREEATNTKGLWKSHVETYFCRIFLKHRHV